MLESDGPVRVIRLNAPERRNALDWAMLDELKAAITAVAGDAAARALVVTGVGKAFCAGADLVDIFGDMDRPVGELRDHLKRVYASFLGLRDLTIPTIAAVNGAAIGAGLNIALACDVVVAGPHAGFGPTFAQIGLHPGGGCSYLMTERLGQAQAMAALLSGEVMPAAEAVRIGLAQTLADEPAAYALELAGTYADRDPRLVAAIKRSVQIAAHGDLAASLEFESWAQASSIGGATFRSYAQRFSDT
ncbi:enoyl-CoA hydratase [Pseudonocardia xishanensis]